MGNGHKMSGEGEGDCCEGFGIYSRDLECVGRVWVRVGTGGSIFVLIGLCSEFLFLGALCGARGGESEYCTAKVNGTRLVQALPILRFGGGQKEKPLLCAGD